MSRLNMTYTVSAKNMPKAYLSVFTSGKADKNHPLFEELYLWIKWAHCAKNPQ
jgi:hypothetical protein